MNDPRLTPVPEPEKNPDADRPATYGKGGPPSHDSIEGPCACGGQHWPGDCPTV
jgi:hypothetical protein